MRTDSAPQLPGSSLAHGIYRLALLAFPRRLRAPYGEEMSAAFAMAYAARRELGRGSAMRLARRAVIDAVRAGLRERWRPGGVSSLPPGTPIGRAVRRSQDAFVNEVGFDFRLAWRSLRSTPGFSLTVILILGLGVGLNAALFTAVKAALLRSAPYPEPDRLVLLDLELISTEEPGPGRAFPWSYPKYELLAAVDDLAADPIAAFATRRLALTGRGDPARLEAEVVTPRYFDVLGVTPRLGRWLTDDDTSAAEVVLSHELWQERFAIDEPAVGNTLLVGGQPLQVVGVAPAGFRGLSGRAELWISMAAVPALISTRLLDNYDGHWLQTIGRLRPDATTATLQDQLAAVGQRVAEQFPWTDPTTRVTGGARPLEEARRNPRAAQAVVVVSSAAALVLLIACTNLAVLMTARGTERRRGIEVRLALGASRTRVMRGLLAEVLLLSSAGAALGLAVASQATATLARSWPEAFADGGWNIRYVDASNLTMDASIVAVTLGLALMTGLAFSLAPALRLTRNASLTARSRGDASSFAARRVLVAVEVALTLVLLVGAALMSTSLGNLLRVDRGFDQRSLLTLTYRLPGANELGPPARFHDELLERVRTIPGVTGATQGTAPLNGHDWISGVRRAGDTVYEEGHRPRVGVNLVDERFFETLGVPLLAGRSFSSTDGVESPAMVVLNQTAARELFPEGNPIGQQFATGVSLTSEGSTAQIIGIVGDVLYDPPALGVMGEAYFLHRQEPDRSARLLVRTNGEPFAVVPAIRSLLAESAPDVPISGITTVAALGAAQTGDTRVLTGLLSLFAGLGTVLAATGLWGIVAYSVSRRERELGVRMALGAPATAVVRLVLRQGLASLAAGAVAGALGALALSSTLSGLLYGVEASDGRSFLAGLLVLSLVAVVASYVPARRASRLDPAQTLRSE